MSYHEADVVVVGGGVAGVCAAIAARRTGARTLLIEKSQFPGGVAAGAWVHSCLTFHGKLGHRIIDGIPQEIIDRLKAMDGTTGHIRDTVGVAYSVTPTDPDKLKLALLKFLDDEGVEYFLDTVFTEVIMDGDRIKAIRGFHCGGRFEAHGAVYVDASGEGILAERAGNSYESGDKTGCQPATLIFKVRNINFKALLRYMFKHMDDFHDETRFDLLKKSPAPGVSGFFRLWKMARLSVPRDRLLFYRTLNPDEVAVNSIRVSRIRPMDPDSMTRAQREAREQMHELFRFLREWIPGFGFSYLAGEAPMLGIREVRRIRGKYFLQRDDLLNGRRFEDEVALGGFPIDIHSPGTSALQSENLGGEGFYGIPYRCLLPEKTPNLLIAGKCLSADFHAHASARVQATSMAMGQAAGVAAGLSVKEKTDPVNLHADKVREGVQETGGLVSPAGKEELP